MVALFWREMETTRALQRPKHKTKHTTILELKTNQKIEEKKTIQKQTRNPKQPSLCFGGTEEGDGRERTADGKGIPLVTWGQKKVRIVCNRDVKHGNIKGTRYTGSGMGTE